MTRIVSAIALTAMFVMISATQADAQRRAAAPAAAQSWAD